MLAAKAEQRPQILQIEQHQALLVGDLEGDVQDPLLGLVQAHQPGQQQRPHLRDRGADGMALLAVEIPEHDRKAALAVIGQAQARDPLFDLGVWPARLAHAGQVALHVGHEHRHPVGAEALRQHLQRHRLAGAGGASNQAVPVGIGQLQILRAVTFTHQDHGILGHAVPRSGSPLQQQFLLVPAFSRLVELAIGFFEGQFGGRSTDGRSP